MTSINRRDVKKNPSLSKTKTYAKIRRATVAGLHHLESFQRTDNLTWLSLAKKDWVKTITAMRTTKEPVRNPRKPEPGA